MALSQPDERRMHPVRLTDIPIQDRLAAAVDCAKRARDDDERADLIAAALDPSPTVYWIEAA